MDIVAVGTLPSYLLFLIRKFNNIILVRTYLCIN